MNRCSAYARTMKLSNGCQVFHIAWEPVAKGRPRFSSRTLANGRTFARAYTPTRTRDAEANIRWLLLQEKPEMYEEHQALRLEVDFVVARPKSVKRKWPVTKPDLDNYLKLLEDAGNGYLWHDDSQIVTVSMGKRYAEAGEAPHIEMRVMPCAT